MESKSGEGQAYHGQQEAENQGSNGFLVSEKTEGVKPTGVEDESTGMGDDDYLGRTNKENRD